MKRSIVTFIALLLSFTLFSQELKFNSDKTFKIVQFTDVHYVAGKDASKYSLDMIKATLDAEKPNMVVLTGDIVVGSPTKKGWDEVLAPLIERKIPYMVTFGNHDDESEMRRHEVAEYVVTKPYLINKRSIVNEVRGYLNYSIAIKGSDGKDGAIVYAMDSHAYSTNPKVKGYGWFAPSQVDWFLKESQKYKVGRQDTLPALAFFHIPLPEYTTAFNDMKNKRVGVRYEAECPPAINSGMFSAMLNSGDVMGTFVGHDHVNDYLVNYYGIALTYGCFSGSANTYQRKKNGARIITLFEGQRKFETYIRENDGEIVYFTKFPF